MSQTVRGTQYHGSVFKVALLRHWVVVVSGPKMVEDFRSRPDDELSFTEGIEEVRDIDIYSSGVTS